MKHEDLDLLLKLVAELRGLAGGSLERDGEVTGVLLASRQTRDRIGRKAEDIGRLVLAAEGAVQTLQLGIAGQQNRHIGGETNQHLGTMQKARQRGLGERGKSGVRTTWGVDGDHRKRRQHQEGLDVS